MKELFYDLIYMIPMSLMFTLFGGNYVGMREASLGVVAGSMLLTIYLGIWRHIKRRERIIMIGIPVIVILGVLGLWGAKKHDSFVAEHLWILWLIFFAGLSLGILCLMNVVRHLRKLAGIGILCFLISALIGHMEVSRVGVALALFLMLVICAEEIQIHWDKSGYPEHKLHLVFVSPFLLLGLLVMCIFPVSEKPYDWSLAKSMVLRAKECIMVLSQNWSGGMGVGYDEAVIGFSDNGQLIGGLNKEPKEVLEITGSQRGIRVYLSGKSFDCFDGRSWSTSDVSQTNDRMLDTMETLYAVERYDPGHREDYYRAADLEVSYRFLDSRYLLAPLKTVTKNDSLDEIGVTQSGGDLLLAKKKGYGTQYEMRYYRLNMGKDVFEKLLRSPIAEDPDLWKELCRKYDLNEDATFTYESLSAHRKHIYEYYLQPISLSADVQELLDRIVGEEETDYDKLVRIEEFLMEFGYSNHPGELPDDIETESDFLDYFLLKNPVGYCSHFATAFVLLARAQGIPARYVQGFYVSKDTKHTAMVTSDMAHAWPEAYIEGVGWIPFEPTPGYKYVTNWKTHAEKEMQSAEAVAATAQAQNMAIAVEEDEPEQPQKPKRSIPWAKLGILMGSCLVFLVLIAVVDYWMFRLHASRLNDEQRIRFLCQQNLKLIELLGYRHEPGETLEEYGERAQKGLPVGALGFIPCYESLVYGNTIAYGEMLSCVRESRACLLAYFKKEKGILFRFRHYREIVKAI